MIGMVDKLYELVEKRVITLDQEGASGHRLPLMVKHTCQEGKIHEMVSLPGRTTGELWPHRG
jgi:hypothetical protein